MDNVRTSGRGTILLAEEEPLLRWSIDRYLVRRGFTVTAVENAAMFAEAAAAQAFDVIVTELLVGGRDGLELAGLARGLRPDCQIIAVANLGSKETVIRALRQGVFDYLEKPLSLELLLISVEKAMERIGLSRELLRLSRTDGLTGLFNQRYFFEVLEREMNRTRRQGRPLTLLLADVDEFKAFNDCHGHLEGDAVLAEVARCLLEGCRRDTDLAFRYGGDEFIVILPEADLAVARDVAARVRVLAGPLVERGVTLSLGAAQLAPDQDVKAFVRHADEAMYLAKQLGGDRMVVFSGA